MKKKFNLYCGLLIAAIVFGIGLSMFETGYYMVQGGMAGVEASRKMRQAGENQKPFDVFERISRITPVEMMPKGEYLMEFNTGDSIVNLKTGEKMPIMTGQGLVMPKNGTNRMKVIQGISYLGCVFIIVFLVAFIKLVIAVNKGRIFEKSMETQLAWGGWSVLAMYVLGWVSALFNYCHNIQEFEFEAYNFCIVQKPDIALLYSAFGMLLMGQIFKIGRHMKEEQDLTI
ncbi:MAG: DUF2975 domain-containing protein [Bacteroidaceae bacterium]|jgi:hypothetical protein|nr:DUF2975 domain-containing protein [Bacteroidaceae bacterium]